MHTYTYTYIPSHLIYYPYPLRAQKSSHSYSYTHSLTQTFTHHLSLLPSSHLPSPSPPLSLSTSQFLYYNSHCLFFFSSFLSISRYHTHLLFFHPALPWSDPHYPVLTCLVLSYPVLSCLYTDGEVTRESGTSASAPVFGGMVTLWNDMRLGKIVNFTYHNSTSHHIYIIFSVLSKPILSLLTQP